MSPSFSRRAFLVIPLTLATLAGCADTVTTAPRLGREVRLAQGVGGVWTVTSLVDPGSGGCDDTECTLREAIAAAAPGDQVVVASALEGTILLTAGQLVVDKNLSVDGNGRITVDAETNSRLVHVTTGTVTLAGLTLRNGREPSANGGGILVTAGSLTVDGLTLELNEARLGGGMYAEATATVTIRNSTLQFNFAARGAAIENNGSLTLDRSTVLVNEGSFGQLENFGVLTIVGSTIGGAFIPGIVNHPGATATIARSTIAGNGTLAPAIGAGIHNVGVLDLRSSTVVNNRAPFGIGGIYNGGTLTVANSIVADNNAISECGGPNAVTSLGFNLTNSGGGCAFSAASDVQVPLAEIYNHISVAGRLDNGGPTKTIALIPGSVAVDNGSCSGETTDQRGFSRPVDNPSISNAADGCDIGAFELQLTPTQQVIVLDNAVTSLSLPKGTTTSLQTKLASVQAAISAGDVAGACSSLTAFINEVNAQAGKKIPASDAANLIAMANALGTELGCA